MKQILTTLFILMVTAAVFAQTPVQVITGANYNNEVYYSFENDTLAVESRGNWDIAFVTAKMSVSVLANNGSGLVLCTYPKGTINDWATVDTTGMVWNPLFNSIEDWEMGAFNAGTDTSNVFDYGWGVYNMATHNIAGDSLFIVKLPDGSFKKMAIIQKNSVQNQWSFKYADLDGQNDTTVTFDADDYSSRGFIHYSLKNKQIVEQEPAERWQLLFTRYYDYTIPYYVTGVLTNSGVSVQQIGGVSQADFKDFAPSLFNDTISQIGSDWKSFNMGTFLYDIADDVVYFVQDTVGTDKSVWKIYFTGFSGSGTGTYSFVKEKMILTGAETIENGARGNVTVYPNPATSQINIIHDFSGKTEISIYSVSGQRVFSRSVVESIGLNKQIINVSGFTPGIYNAVVRSGNRSVSSKFVKE
jgi:hypothetical protein